MPSATQGFFANDWFNRVWTLQEAALARQIVATNSNGEILEMGKILRGLVHAKIALAADSIIYDVKMTTQMMNIAEVCARTTKMTNMTVLSMVSHRKCYKEQDKVYGVLGLMNLQYGIEVDYRKSSSDVMLDLYSSMLKQGDTSFMDLTGFQLSHPGLCLFPDMMQVQPGSEICSRVGPLPCFTDSGVMVNCGLYSVTKITPVFFIYVNC